jgi:multisubunit Na+/H+ antiporter MnhB subunit
MTANESDIEATQKVATDIITSTERSENEVIKKAPDGGLRAWLVTAGTACIFFSALGFSNSFGIFEEYYLSHQLKNESADKVAWIGSLAAFLQFATGALGGPLFDRYGAWVCSSNLSSHQGW